MRTGKALLGMVAGIATGAILGAVLVNKSRKRNISIKGEALINAINDRIDEKFEELLGGVDKKSKTRKEVN